MKNFVKEVCEELHINYSSSRSVEYNNRLITFKPVNNHGEQCAAVKIGEDNILFSLLSPQYAAEFIERRA